MKNLSKFALTILALALVLAAAATPGSAQTNGWSAPYRFSEAGWFPDIAADPAGGLHVAWSHSRYVTEDGEPATVDTAEYGYDVVLYAQSRNGLAWSKTNDVLAIPQANVNSVEVTRPNFWVDDEFILHLTYRGLDVYYAQAPSDQADEAHAWSRPIRLNISNLGYFADLWIDANQVFHLVYTENVPDANCRICYHLFYRQSLNGGADWTSRSDLTQITNGAAKPQIIQSRSGALHVVWEAGPGGTLGMVTQPVQIMYTRSEDSGITWETARAFTNPALADARNPAIGLDGAGTLVVAWHNLVDDRIHYRTSSNEGQTWSAGVIETAYGERLLRDANQNGMAMASDSAGQVHLVFTGRLDAVQTSWSLLHMVWDGAGWSAPEEIVNRATSAIDWPRIAVSQGNQLNVVWYERPLDHIWDANPDFYTVYYSRKTIAAPPIAPVEQPTATATLQPTPVILPTPTPTPAIPDLNRSPIDPNTTYIISSEVDDLIILGASLIPGILLTALIILILRLRRR